MGGRKAKPAPWSGRPIRGRQLELFSREPVFVVRNFWGPWWLIEDPHGNTVRGATRWYPTPQMAAHAATSKGFQVLLVEQFPGQRRYLT